MDDIAFIDPQTLIPHPDRDLAGSTLRKEEGKFRLIKESVETDGINDPLKIQAGTNVIIGGHTRHRIALELGLPEVPVHYYDVNDETARYLMVLDNHKRTGDEKDAMKLSWTFKIVVKSIGIPHGGSRRDEVVEGEAGPVGRKTLDEIAALFDMKKSNFKRYLALLKLIPQLQELVSQEKIGVKTGSILSRLSSENQRKVFDSIPPDRIKKADYRLTENEAKSFVEAYGDKEVEVQENAGNDPESDRIVEAFDGSGDESVESDNPADGLRWFKDDEGNNVDEIDGPSVIADHSHPRQSVVDQAKIALAADQYVKSPSRNLIFAQACGVDVEFGKEGHIAIKKMEGAAKQIACQLVLMEDEDKRIEFACKQLQTAITKQYDRIDRIDSELMPLRIVVADEMNPALTQLWDELCVAVERVGKKLAMVAR